MPDAAVLHSTRPLSRARILLAEDDFELRRMLSMLLSADGYEVVEVTNGQQLLDYLRQRRSEEHLGGHPDLIISDVCMPEVDGLQVLEQLRDAQVPTPVVLMTAFANASICDQADELGAVTLLMKPFELDDLRMIVLNLADRSRALRQNQNDVVEVQEAG